MSINSICLIDDDPIFVFGTKVILNNNSEFCSSILVYENGREALESLTALLKSENQIPEVIFLDLNMPVMNGWEFLDELCKIPEISYKTVVFILSSSMAAKDIKKSKAYKIVKDFICKPLTESKFSKLLEEISMQDFKKI